MTLSYNCYRRWQPNYACQMVNGIGEYRTKEECINQCQPQQVPGFEIIGMENSCNGGYFSEHRAETPQQCAAYCNQDTFGDCRYFMWDSTKEKQNPEFIVDDNCIIFTNIPHDCTEMITTYPASLGSIMYKNIDYLSPSGLY